MSEETRSQWLKIVLVASGVIFLVGVAALMQVWPAGFAWTPRQYEYEQMIMGVYAILGIFLLLASRAPAKHHSLILFAGWSSVVHGLVMGAQAVVDETERTHLIGDVPALIVIGVALILLAPSTRQRSSQEQTN